MNIALLGAGGLHAIPPEWFCLAGCSILEFIALQNGMPSADGLLITRLEEDVRASDMVTPQMMLLDFGSRESVGQRITSQAS
ncbi:hypothetical protein BFW88_23720 [Pseudomonas fluorescens]|nr:hypothetical protein BFW88_23720 [Pseudomonas fluorescens]OPB05041.1 hypothetical protein BFW92_23665 [Pseudomonas fluorescens]OPB16343.1 hypothetical protein BFW93_23690 [Pseudomonas fluorescens]